MTYLECEVIDRTLILCISGPLTPDNVSRLFIKAIPHVTQLDTNGKPWGSIIIVEEDASWFSDAINLLVSNLKLPYFKRRICMALVALPEVKDSAVMMHSIIEQYGHKVSAKINMFPDMMTASKWVDRILIEADT